MVAGRESAGTRCLALAPCPPFSGRVRPPPSTAALNQESHTTPDDLTRTLILTLRRARRGIPLVQGQAISDFRVMPSNAALCSAVESLDCAHAAQFEAQLTVS